MNKSLCLSASLLALNLTPVFGQLPPQPPHELTPNSDFQQRLHTTIDKANFASQDGAQTLTKFNLDFAGGPPDLLVKAIEKATGKPLNIIIPNEDAQEDLPPLKMNDVDAPQLFVALEAASEKLVTFQYGLGNSYSTFTRSYGFRTADGPSPKSDASIWYFHDEKPSVPPLVSDQKICQFYSLSPYLDRGFTVDDITTAIQTGWKMAGITPTPDLNYHKETKLLIAYGEPDKLKTIADVLKTLPTTNEEYWQRYWQETHNTILDLQGQIDFLKKKILPPSTNATPMENTGK
jgi:hypothetical protein